MVLLLSAGCGDDDPMADPDGSSDASQSDAVVDTSPPEPEPVTVTVYSLSSGQEALGPNDVVEGATVLFHDLDGAVAEEMLTGADGKASRLMPHGGHVTVIWDEERQLVTVTEVQAGDDLVVGNPYAYEGGSESPLATMTVTLPGAAAGAGYHQIRTSCGASWYVADPTMPQNIEIWAPCASPMDIVATGHGETGLEHYSVMNDVAIVDAGTVTLPAWENDFTTQTVTLTNASSSSWFYIEGTVFSGDYYLMDHETSLGGEGPLSAEVRYIPGVGTTFETRIYEGFNGDGERILVRRSATIPDDMSFNVGTGMLPRVEQPSFSDGMISWPVWGAPVGDDGTWVEMGFYRTNGETWEYWDWYFAAAPGAGMIAVPTLPEAWAKYDPSVAGAQLNWGEVYMLAADFLEAADFRARAGTRFAEEIYDGDALLPATGEVRLSSSQNGD